MLNQFSVGYSDSAFIFLDTFNAPTKSEIDSFSSGAFGEIRFVEVNDVIFFLFKLGNMSWQDAPFTLHWYDPNPFSMPPLAEGQGYMFQLLLVDGLTGKQKAARIVGAGERFSENLRTVITNNYAKLFNIGAYRNKIAKTYQMYTSEQLAELCPEEQRYIIGT